MLLVEVFVAYKVGEKHAIWLYGLWYLFDTTKEEAEGGCIVRGLHWRWVVMWKVIVYSV